jgi:serine/threonine protein kinase
VTTRKTSQPAKDTGATSIPSGAHALAAIGPVTEGVVNRLFAGSNELFNRVDQGELKKLASALEKDRGWTDQEAARVVSKYAEDVDTGRSFDVSAIARWALAHPNNSSAVFDCMSVAPPEGFNIIRVLSRAGSQKLVFLASWRLPLRQVVLKRVTGPTKDTIIDREAQVHPLSMRNRNIIETHVFQNAQGEKFLVEERLPVVLDDNWRSHGLHEAANLLHDIANALSFLHELDFVHGDIKPDNIGKKNEDYILLDFGIGRTASKFTPEVTGTGSLRTRAPELITTDSYKFPTAADVWALGATVYNTITERFPLFEKGETPPRISNPEDRKEFEAKLAERINSRWEHFLDFSHIPDPMKKILQKALAKDPEKRSSAKQLVDFVEKELSGFLRRNSHDGRFSALEEVDQLLRYLPSGSDALRACFENGIFQL